jgi:phosphoribosylanthranilate isomerase
MTNVKICGITNFEDARAAAEAGANLLGFIFYEPSPRYVTPEKVREIVQEIKEQVIHIEPKQVDTISDYAPGPTQHVTCVGVFVNSPVETVHQILDFCRLDAVQLHGEEPPEEVASFHGRAFKALRPQSQQEAETLIQTYLPSPNLPLDCPGQAISQSLNLPRFLLDAYHPHLYGGTGYVTDWTMAARIARQYPIMLAGSLTLANVAEAIRMVKPWGVDVSSGVEVEKGKKDHEKVGAFVKVVKSAYRKERL